MLRRNIGPSHGNVKRFAPTPRCIAATAGTARATDPPARPTPPSPAPPAPDLRQPLAMVAVAEQVVPCHQYDKWNRQARCRAPVPPPSGVDPPLYGIPCKAAHREQRPLGPGQGGRRQAQRHREQGAATLPIQAQAHHRHNDEEGELPRLQAPAGRPHREGRAAAHQPHRHPPDQNPMGQRRQAGNPPQHRGDGARGEGYRQPRCSVLRTQTKDTPEQ